MFVRRRYGNESLLLFIEDVYLPSDCQQVEHSADRSDDVHHPRIITKITIQIYFYSIIFFSDNFSENLRIV